MRVFYDSNVVFYFWGEEEVQAVGSASFLVRFGYQAVLVINVTSIEEI